MKINSLLEKYSFHDSTIERIEYEKTKRILTITIDFCYWVQNDFVEGDKENGIIDLVFHEVVDYKGLLGNVDSYGILDALEMENGLELKIEDAFNGKFYDVIIKSMDVDLIKNN